MTGVGVLLGTAAYMSPEQAVGKAMDKRSDVWAFGVVLLEMLTGRPVFTGETVPHILADVLRAEIDFRTLPAATPAPIRELLKRCLDRDVKTRLRDIGEARVAIQRWLANPAETRVEPRLSAARTFAFRWAAIFLLGIAASGLAFVHFREQPPATCMSCLWKATA